jgi:tetratricopeptide (TPR) repeat protein
LPKAVRAELHERFADWLDDHGTSLVELDELVGYHLEQAHRYRSELGPLDDAATGLGERAASHLLAGATRAYDRGDLSAAIGLLTRGRELLPPGHAELPATGLRLSEMVSDQGDFDRSEKLLGEAEKGARAAGDERILARCRLERLEQQQAHQNRKTTLKDALAGSREVLAQLESFGDEEGVVSALRLIGMVTFWLGSNREAEAHWRQALERSEGASPRIIHHVVSWRLLGASFGPTPVGETIRLCDETLAEPTSKRLEAIAVLVRGVARACEGNLPAGREEAAQGRELLRDLGHRMTWAGSCVLEAEMELSAGNPERAEQVLVEGRDVLAASAETGYLASVVGMLAHSAAELGKDDEALRRADEVGTLASPDDFEPHAMAHLVRARVLARRGDFTRAEGELGAGAALIEVTDHVLLRWHLALARAEIAGRRGRPEEERQALEQVLAVTEAKGNRLLAGRIRAQLDD